MKKLMLLVMLVAMAQGVMAQAILLPVYEQERRNSQLFAALAVVGAGLTVWGLHQSANHTGDDINGGAILMSGVGGGALTFGIISGVTSHNRATRIGALIEKGVDISVPIQNAIARKQVIVGMDHKHLTASWGRPMSVNYSSYGPDQWVFGGYRYVYLKGGIVTAWN